MGRRFIIAQSGTGQQGGNAFDGLMEECCSQAMEENKPGLMLFARDKEHADKYSVEEVIQKVRAFIISCEKAYADFLEDKWEDMEEVYPEVRFSYFMGDGVPDSVKENLTKRKIFCDNVWMNGTADLIYKKRGNGGYCLIDYKSDHDLGVTEEDMEEYLTKKYTPQLQVYQSVIQDMLGVPLDKIDTGLVSFSQKDAAGNFLKGNEVRVRYTKI